MDNLKEIDANEAESTDETTDIDNSDEGENSEDKDDLHITDEEEWMGVENLQTYDNIADTESEQNIVEPPNDDDDDVEEDTDDTKNVTVVEEAELSFQEGQWVRAGQ